jgi:hypothetical protein
MPHAATVAGASLAALLTLSCRSDPPPPKRVPAAQSAKPVDRLAPGELAPGSSRVFGLDVPRGMHVRGQFSDSAYLEGDVAPEALANYVRERVDVENVEIGAARTVFPHARIKAGAADRVYQLEVVARHHRRSELVIRDVTPVPKKDPAPMSNADRWRAIGRDPQGRPLDMVQFR